MFVDEALELIPFERPKKKLQLKVFLTDNADEISPLVVLEDPAVAVAIGHEEDVGGVSHRDGGRCAKVSLVRPRNESFTQNKIGCRTVAGRKLNVQKSFISFLKTCMDGGPLSYPLTPLTPTVFILDKRLQKLTLMT